MSVGEVKTNTSLPIQNTEASNIQGSNKAGDKSTVLNTIFSKLAEGKDFIFKTLNGRAGALITIGQVGGVAAMTLGGASLIFSGIAANLTVGGIPLGIPLLVGGAALFTAGTGLLIAKLVANANSTLGQKIKDFLTITGKNIGIGLGIGVLGAGAISQKNVAELATSTLPAMVNKANEVKEKVEEIAPKVFEGVNRVNNFINPDLDRVVGPQKKDVDENKGSNKQDTDQKDVAKTEGKGKESIALEKDKEKTVDLPQIKKEEVGASTKETNITDKERTIEQKAIVLMPDTMRKELDEKALDFMRFLMAYYVFNNQDKKL